METDQKVGHMVHHVMGRSPPLRFHYKRRTLILVPLQWVLDPLAFQAGFAQLTKYQDHYGASLTGTGIGARLAPLSLFCRAGQNIV